LKGCGSFPLKRESPPLNPEKGVDCLCKIESQNNTQKRGKNRFFKKKQPRKTTVKFLVEGKAPQTLPPLGAGSEGKATRLSFHPSGKGGNGKKAEE